MVLYRLTPKAPLQTRITPRANTIPGIEYGNNERISKNPLPLGFTLMTTYAIITPRNMVMIPEETDRNRLFTIES